MTDVETSSESDQPESTQVESDQSESARTESPSTGPGSTTLQAALTWCGLDLPAAQVAGLDRYCQLLWSWNLRLNLTRHTDYDRFVARDVVDSLALAELLEPGEHVLDLGTGGGVPGIILAIVRPDLHVTLSESIAKKAAAVKEIVQGLGLPIRVEHGRGEALLAKTAPRHRKDGIVFDTIVVRAVARLEKILTWVAPHWSRLGRLLLIKGPSWVDERRVARERHLLNDLQLRRSAVYNTPGTEAESVILQVWPKDS